MARRKKEEEVILDAPKKTVEEWAKAKGTKVTFFAIARKQNRWPIGKEVTEVVFDEGILKARNHRIA